MKPLRQSEQAVYQHRRHYRLVVLVARYGTHAGLLRRSRLRARPDLWRRWQTRHLHATHRMAYAWWLRLASRQMLRGLQGRWPLRYTLWMLRQCVQEHKD